MALIAVILDVFGFSSNAALYRVTSSRSLSVSAMIRDALSLRLGSAASSTFVLSNPSPARATAAARLALRGNAAAASRAVPEKKTWCPTRASRLQHSSAAVPAQAHGGLAE